MGLFRKRNRVLALGGGSARGLCNIGVLKVLERHYGRGNLPFDMIIGTSIGSLIGAAYCTGCPVEEMEEKALKFNWPHLVDFGIHSTGLIKGKKLENIILDRVGDKTFKDLKIPFALTTTDLQTGEERVHTSGDLITLIRASCSWPGIFTAVEVEGHLLADGGVRNSIPTKAACQLGSNFMVAVNPGFGIASHKIDNPLKAIVQSVQIMGEELNAYQARAANVEIRPVLQGIDQFDFDKGSFIIKEGEDAAERQMPQIKRKLFISSIKEKICVRR